MVDISTFTFGAPAAERDSDLGDYFVESESYRLLERSQKTIILGNRGSGKSALFKILAKRKKQSGEIVLEIAPENYAYEILRDQLVSEKGGSWAKQGAYAAAWKYLLYIKILKELNKSKSGLKTGAAKVIYDFLRDNFKDEQANPAAILLSYLKRLEAFKIGEYEIKLKTAELARLYELDEISFLFKPLDELSAKFPISVFVDELDRGWDASEDAKAFVAGVVQAALYINDHHPGIRVYVSLRRELYDSIPALYEDAQKYRDVMEFIQWDEESLLDLITKRIKRGVSAPEETPPQKAWQLLFEETIQYRQSKSFNYIVDRTLYRPRELIQFCSQILDDMRKRQELPPIDYDEISRAETAFSSDRAKDIAAEYRFQFPGLADVMEAFRGKAYSFTREELEMLCLQIVSGEIDVGPEAKKWLDNQDPDYLIEVLWRVGFLRAMAVGGVKALRRSGSQYLGSHQIDHLNLRSIPRFTIHQMFRSGLGLKETKSSQEDDSGD